MANESHNDWQTNIASARKGLAQFTQAVEQLTLLRDATTAEIAKYLRSESGTEIDIDAIQQMVERPYTLIPINEHEAWLIQARAVKMPMVGWLVAQDGAFNKFRVSRSMDLVTPIPQWMKDELGWKPPAHAALIDGTRTSLRVTQGDEVSFKRKYGGLLGAKQADGRYKIRGGDAWIKLVAHLIRDGILPYAPQPVADEHWDDTIELPEVLRDLFRMRPFLQNAINEFRAKGAVLANLPPGAGKTMLTLAILNHFRGNVLILADTTILIEQWRDRVKRFVMTSAAKITLSTYQGAQKYLDQEWDLVIPDEAQRLPANTFSRLAFIKTKYRLGLTGTPWREDDRQFMITALSGFPVSLRWAELVQAGVLKRPRIIVATVQTEAAKTAYVRQLLAKRKSGRALIFCDWIEQGQKLADDLDIPFVHGETARKLERIQESEVCVVSRIGDRGLDLPDLRLVIEVAGAGAAREQFAQRVGRLLHGAFAGEFHTVFTPEEAGKFRPRIFGVEAELAGEVDIEFVNIGNIQEKPSREIRMRGSRIPAREQRIIDRPTNEVDVALSNPAVAKLIEQAYAKVPMQVQQERKINSVLKLGWDSPISLDELKAGKGLSARAILNYKAAFAAAERVELMTRVGNGWMTNKAKIKKLIELSQRFRK